MFGAGAVTKPGPAGVIPWPRPCCGGAIVVGKPVGGTPAVRAASLSALLDRASSRRASAGLTTTALPPCAPRRRCTCGDAVTTEGAAGVKDPLPAANPEATRERTTGGT